MVRERSGGDFNIPLDVKLEILKKLPAKSIVRFLCLSKLWKTIIRDYIVKDSIVSRSLTQPPRDPHFIFARVHWSSLSFHTSPTYSSYYHHQTTHEEQQLVSLEDSYSIPNYQYVRGLIGYESAPSRCHQFTIHNPTTGQTVSLSNTVYQGTQCVLFNFFLGYDPLSNQYKVVYLARKLSVFSSKETFCCQVYTLGDLKNQWRIISCEIKRPYYPFRDKLCINGVIYYKAISSLKTYSFVLGSFDVGFERFNHVQTPGKLSICLEYATLVVYQGKLGCICKNNLDMDFWVLENAERQEWSKIKYIDVLRDLPSYDYVRFAGITYSDGEIVIVGESQEPTVYYYDMKLKKITKVEIKTTMSPRERICILNVVSDHVDNIMSLS